MDEKKKGTFKESDKDIIYSHPQTNILFFPVIFANLGKKNPSVQRVEGLCR